MRSAYFYAGCEIRPHLPRTLLRPHRTFSLTVSCWDLLILNRDGCRRLLSDRCRCDCGTLLLPREFACAVTQLVRAQQVVSTGMSGCDTLTCSSLRDADTLVCLQRALRRTDGTWLEPQEFLFPRPAPLSAEEHLLLCGAQLLLD